MKRFLFPALALPAAMLLAACGSQKGETVFTAGTNSSGDVGGKAPYAGTYTLYTAMSPNPTNTITLKEGDPLGFRKTADGRIEAFWLDKTYDFDKATSQAYWKVEK